MNKIYIIIFIIIIIIVLSSVKKYEKEKFAFTTQEEDILRSYAQNNNLLSKVNEIATMSDIYVKIDDANNIADSKIANINFPVIPDQFESRLLTADNKINMDKSSAFFEGVDINNINNKYTNFSDQIYTLLPDKILNTSNNLYGYLNQKVEEISSKVDISREPESTPDVRPLEVSGSTDKFFKFIYKDEDNVKGYTQYDVVFFEPTYCDFLIIGGGGGGSDSGKGTITKRGGGGGGAGGYISKSSVLFLKGNYIIKVGRGGLSSESGIDSSIDGENSFIASGGGAGGSPHNDKKGKDGGSGGGGADPAGDGGLSTQNKYNGGGFGNKGGKAINTYATILQGGGGGGGAGGIGGDSDELSGGLGGQGIANNIASANLIYASGGAGGSNRAINSEAINNGVNGVANTGNGGGGGGLGGNGGTGGSGIVVIRYRSYNVNEKISTNIISIDELNKSLVVLQNKQSELSKIN